VRKAFTADVSKGHTLVVADYGQLELRILAHMAECKSMINAFKLGGDFHSRTALGMYDHIKEAIHKGKRHCSKYIVMNAQHAHRPPPQTHTIRQTSCAERRCCFSGRHITQILAA